MPMEMPATSNLVDLQPIDKAVEEIRSAGYLDPDTWQHVDTRVKKMSKAENTLFWETMFAAMENGEIQVLDSNIR